MSAAPSAAADPETRTQPSSLRNQDQSCETGAKGQELHQQSLQPNPPAELFSLALGISLDESEGKAAKEGDEDQDGQCRAEPSDLNFASHYWDAESMATVNAVSAAAIARLRAYRPPPFPTWDRLPVTRRAAVLILLFADRRGDLRVVITMRAASLRNFSGHAAFPGGKADSLTETPVQIARREAWEEIGLPQDDHKIPHPFRIEPLCMLPCSLAKTELAVRPCVAFLHADAPSPGQPVPLVEESMIPRLDAKEVAAVFSAPFRNFLRTTDEEPAAGAEAKNPSEHRSAKTQKINLPPGHWYDGRWSQWHGIHWRVHNFHVPVHLQWIARPRTRPTAQEALADDEYSDSEASPSQRFLVWGMTGRILVDCARIAYAEEPEFEHNQGFGEEALITRLEGEGKLFEKEGRRRRVEVGVAAFGELGGQNGETLNDGTQEGARELGEGNVEGSSVGDAKI